MTENNNTSSTQFLSHHKLIIAEKPKVMRAIVAALYDDSPVLVNNTYYEGNTYIITTVMGHLFEAYDIEDYEGESKPWSYDNIPFYPENFLYRLKRDKKTGKTDAGMLLQFNTIKSLIERDDVDEIINCADADREGEVLVRIVIRNIKASQNKKQTRLWINDTTKDTIRLALKTRKDAFHYDGLANEGFARLYEDWLYGINLTRYVTLKATYNSGKKYTFRVGRVLIAIVKAIYERDREIANFKPVKYFSLYSEDKYLGIPFILKSKKEFPIEEPENAQKQCDIYNDMGGTVIKADTNVKTIPAPKLFSTTSLQNAASKKYAMSPLECLNHTQVLYEKGYVTYPRTNTEYLSENEKGRIRKIVQNINTTTGEDFLEFKDTKNIFNNEYVESHSAITITDKIPSEFTSPDEKTIYELIKNRFFAVFCKELCTVNRTEIKIKSADEIFSITGDISLTEGWKMYEKTKSSDKELPPFKVGDNVKLNFAPKESTTAPPRHYTVTTLNDFLETPFKEEEKLGQENNDQDLLKILDGIQIGTGATRAPIIDKAIQNGYIILKKKSYFITDVGNYLIEALDDLGINLSKEKTIEMNSQLKKVSKGELTIEQVLSKVKEEIDQIFENSEAEITPFEGIIEENTVICRCPDCGGDIVARKNFYGCTNYKEKNCTYGISNRIFGTLISPSAARELIKNGKTARGLTFKNKDNIKYKAHLLMRRNPETQAFQFKTEIIPPKELKSKCPICGGTMLEKNGFYGCANYSETGCIYSFPKKIFGTSISLSNADALIAKGKIDEPIYFSSKNKKKYRAYLYMKYNAETMKNEFTTEYAGIEKVGCKCPKCNDGDVVVYSKSFGCSNYSTTGCNFTLWKKQFGKNLSSSQAKELLEKGHTGKLKFKSARTGNDFDAYLILKEDYSTELQFPSNDDSGGKKGFSPYAGGYHKYR